MAPRLIRLASGASDVQDVLLLGTRFAVVQTTQATQVFDLQGAPERVLDRPTVASATHGSSLITLDADLTCTRWIHDGRWRPDATVRLPEAARDCDKLALSRTGRFAVADGAAPVLLDLEQGRIVASFEASYGTARACFDVLPDGREVLFVAAPGYMSVAMIDAESGATLAAYTERESTDFCHVRFRLAAHGTLLCTFGCVWAAPYETRIYDARPWTGGAPPGPLRLVTALEPLVSNLMIDPDVSAAGEITSASLEQLEEDDLEWARERDPALTERLLALPRASWALVTRRLDPSSAAVVATSVHAVPKIDERHMHHADGHRVVLVGPRLLLCNGDQLDDHGPLDLPEGARSAVARDASLVVIA